MNAETLITEHRIRVFVDNRYVFEPCWWAQKGSNT